MHALDLPATARISLSFYNDEEDIDKFAKAILKARKIING
jgi:selenocysteine lyase/cysteine desulfurase